MKNSTKLVCAALLSAGLGTAALSAQAASHHKPMPPGMEKCYGITKAGKNDCGGKGTGHSCKGHSTHSGDKNDWMLVPKGLCNRINGGHLKGW